VIQSRGNRIPFKLWDFGAMRVSAIFDLVRCETGLTEVLHPRVTNLLPSSNVMRRIAAHLAIVAIGLGSFVPLLIATQLSPANACCLRSGTHHCQSSIAYSTETEFRAPRSSCPYSAPLPLRSFSGLETGQFLVAAPARAGFMPLQSSLASVQSTVHRFPARAPPVLFS
jgi:hypothetical protein